MPGELALQSGVGGLTLGLSGGCPLPVSPAFHLHASFGGGAVYPPGKSRVRIPGRTLRPFFWPISGEGNFHVAIAPRSGNRSIVAQRAGPGTRQFVAITIQLHGAAKSSGVARVFYVPGACCVRAIL